MKTCNDAPVGYTDHPPVGEWQGWNGGVCPVHPLATVEYVMAGGDLCKDHADQLDWESTGIDDWDIIAYRIIEEYKPEPERVAREFWACEMKVVSWDSFESGEMKVAKTFWQECSPESKGATLFREVLQ